MNIGTLPSDTKLCLRARGRGREGGGRERLALVAAGARGDFSGAKSSGAGDCDFFFLSFSFFLCSSFF